MPKARTWLALTVVLAGCNTAGYDVVSISPIYGWTDGCNTVRVSGHGFSETATAALGELALDINARGEGIDAGYWVEATLPPAPVTEPGYATVTVTSDGVASSVPDAYYYVACLQLGNLESLDSEVAAAGQAIGMVGCQLDASALTVRLSPQDQPERAHGRLHTDVPFTSSCGTATASFVAPALDDGVYDVELVDAAGATVFPPYACPAPPWDTAGALLWCPTLTYGDAQ